MKKSFVLVLAMILCAVSFILTSCEVNTDTPAEPHVCEHVCEVCRRCNDASCNDEVCKVKCAGHEAMYAVVVTLPEDWTNPNLWAWSDPDGKGAFESWPGEPFKALDNGNYYCYVPGFVNTIIINANQGTEAAVQTDGITIEREKNQLVVVDASKQATVSELPATEVVPAYVETFKVHAYVPLTWETVQMWAWSHPDGQGAFAAWPGEEMVAEVKDGEPTGWYTGKVPTWINRLIVNGNKATDAEKTADMEIGEPKEMWITIAKDLSHEISYTDPAKAVENITIHAKVPATFEKAGCWAWSAPDGTNAFTTWPGEELTKEGDWFVISAPGWINSVIINNFVAASGLQTTDVSVEKGKDIWVVVSETPGADGKYTAVVTYEEPAK